MELITANATYVVIGVTTHTLSRIHKRAMNCK
nr:MAG TPA: hypothetical protein [Caudoviricetes sp.]